MPEMVARKTVADLGKEKVEEVLHSVKQALTGKKGTLLTKKEAEEYYEPLKRAIQDTYGDTLDKLISWKIGYALAYPIWGDITDFEAEALSKILVKRGQQNTHAAALVRKMVIGEDYITVGVLFAPRIKSTADVLKAARENENNSKRN